MKTHQAFKVVPIALVMNLVLTQAILAQTPPIEISRTLPQDPLIVNGTSGGAVSSNCGNITKKPAQVIQIKESLPYLRLTVESAGKPTLLIDGPGGRFCILADSYSGGKPQFSGYWQPGNYSLYVGELSPAQHSYTLSISQQQQPSK
ncbi:hypothetical protein [Calothrix sp. PCC 7507]|uniref:hypothetical protein n=1 Tax=Calothrix sp. PCC 7507 TaxID=99598 RepID=UPI00029F2FE4|nr:hypothetical protein [Calothrix sp. PCC 7507]AFY36100.1 hypothetical protein Cal7507_5781 [Calothrix sp. PCC 7507]